jgi:iron complex outermembrane receptor protein
MRGETHGAEIATNWNVTERWRLIPSYSWLQLNMRLDGNSVDKNSRGVERQNPRHQFQFRSNLDLSRRLQFDTAAYYTGALPNLAIPAYTRLDARFGYRPREDFELSLSGQNLQGGRHTEFFATGPFTRTTIGRSVMLALTWGL